MDERKSKEIKSVESSISLDLTAEKRARKDLDAKIMKQVDETALEAPVEAEAAEVEQTEVA